MEINWVKFDFPLFPLTLFEQHGSFPLNGAMLLTPTLSPLQIYMYVGMFYPCISNSA
jgi:hypothetical protein